MKMSVLNLFWRYLEGLVLVILGTLIGYVSKSFLTPTDIIMVYLLGIVIAAIFLGLGPAMLVSILSILARDFFLMAPYLSIGPLKLYDLPPLFVLLGVSIIISYLASRLRFQTEKATSHEKHMQALYVLSRNLAACDELESSVDAIIKSARETVGLDVLLYLPSARNSSLLKQYPESAGTTPFEKNIAVWTYQNKAKAGHNTSNFPQSKTLYLPLITAKGAIGTIALVDIQNSSNAEQNALVAAFADLVAVAIERLILAEETIEMRASQQNTEKLQTSLLDSISHDLRTPLSSVIGVLETLQEGELDEPTRKNLVQVASEQAERLNDYITDLLDTSRIRAGVMSIYKQPCDVNDVISFSIDELGERGCNRIIGTHVENGQNQPLFIMADYGLLVKVLLNLLDNAIKYSPPESPIEIFTRQIGDEVEIEIADRGIGIPPGHLTDIFTRFVRFAHNGSTGTGLGLSICKGIVEAHGGRIIAENRTGGGTVFRVIFPAPPATRK
jgi:two-component system, OmpR family, sensor histidine kinase KdpD